MFFASASAVEAFLDQYGVKALVRKELYVMGEPTRRALVKARISLTRCKITPLV